MESKVKKLMVATTKMWWRRKRLVLERNELNSLIRLGNGLGKTLRSKQPDCLVPLRGEQKVHSTTNGILHGLRTPREEIAFTARPKIHSHSQIFRYGGSIFCLPHRPNFSDIFDLCLHWVSVVRGILGTKGF